MADSSGPSSPASPTPPHSTSPAESPPRPARRARGMQASAALGRGSRGIDRDTCPRIDQASTVSHRGRGRGSRGQTKPPPKPKAKQRKQGKKAANLGAFDLERVKALQEKRADDIQGAISKMTKTQMADILHKALEQQPGLLFNVWEEIYSASTPSASCPTSPGPSSSGPSSSGPPSPDKTPPPPPWCKCSNCREMPTDLERLCCGLKPQNCVSKAAALELLVLDPHVLQIANWYRQDVLVRNPGYDKRAKRHSAYRQFTLWRHGRLGSGIRRVIPSCVVWRIRKEYRELSGQYTGFILNRLM